MSNSLLELLCFWNATLICNSFRSNELDQCPIWDTKRLDAVYDTNGLASYLITRKSYEDTDWTLTDFKWRLKITSQYINCPV